MSQKRGQLREHLEKLASALYAMDCWDERMPPGHALASSQPFAVDTLELYQWLQWIFLPRMHELLDRELPLPASCGITPVAEEWLKMREFEQRQVNELLQCLAAIDELVEAL